MNILRLSILSLVISVFMPIDANAHCKGKHTGNHEHCLGDGGGGGGSGEYSGSEGVVFISPSDVGEFDYHIIGTTAQDTINAGSGSDLIEAGDDRDEITALGGNDEIHGQAGHDTIDGGEGTDLLLGGAGDDTLLFSLGGDTYDGGAGYDHLRFQTAITLTVDIATESYVVTTTNSSGAQVTEFGIWQNIESIGGGPGNDFITGDASARNHIGGGEGDDFIVSGAGDDKLGGGMGHDIIYGGLGDDSISGSSGEDQMFGEGGNDVLEGRDDGWDPEHDDVLSGGDGCDVFIFTGQFGIDTILDFGYPYAEPACELISLPYRATYNLDFDDLSIDVVGNDIVIDFWITKHGGNGGTIILKDADLNGVVIDESNVTF
jgi:Ca2+-binding RTX toxin-like protein